MSLWDFYQEHSHRLILPLLHISWRGVRVDQAKRKAAIAWYDAEEAKVTQQLCQGLGRAIDPFSPKQLMDHIYGEMGVKEVWRVRKRITGEKISTRSLDETAIAELLTRPIPPQVYHTLQLVLRIRELHKINSTYLKAKLDPDGRLRCSYVITGDQDFSGGTETGRISSRATPYGTGTNLQNVPPGIARQIVIPDDGMVFVAADLSQAEARVVAYLAREPRLIAVFEGGGDIHRRNASAMFRCPEAAVHPHQRYLAKRVIHASNYGMGVQRFAQVAGLQKAEAGRLLAQYFATYPRIKVWHLETEDTLRRTRVLRTPLGHVRQFFGPWGDDLKRKAYAFVPQSTVSGILNAGLIDYETSGPGDILLQEHDGFTLQCRRESVDEACQQLRTRCTRPVTILGQRCTIPVTIRVGDNWDELK